MGIATPSRLKYRVIVYACMLLYLSYIQGQLMIIAKHYLDEIKTAFKFDEKKLLSDCDCQ